MLVYNPADPDYPLEAGFDGSIVVLPANKQFDLAALLNVQKLPKHTDKQHADRVKAACNKVLDQFNVAGLVRLTGDSALDSKLIKAAEEKHNNYIREICLGKLARWQEHVGKSELVGVSPGPEPKDVQWARKKVADRKL